MNVDMLHSLYIEWFEDDAKALQLPISSLPHNHYIEWVVSINSKNSNVINVSKCLQVIEFLLNLMQAGDKKAQATELATSKNFRVQYMPYDWSTNSWRHQGQRSSMALDPLRFSHGNCSLTLIICTRLLMFTPYCSCI